MNLWQRLKRMRTEPDAYHIGRLDEFSSSPSWIWRVIVLFALLALGVGLLTILVAGLPSQH